VNSVASMRDPYRQDLASLADVLGGSLNFENLQAGCLCYFALAPAERLVRTGVDTLPLPFYRIPITGYRPRLGSFASLCAERQTPNL
jgi:hypothetical protein